ncbi:sigma-70 family RNA polymerase sigma factor [Myxococcota bacterium]|nr:sigma-70 family RNA polymerase sigma factor [Myxococcota bacterium]
MSADLSPVYARALGRCAPLSREEEAELARRYQAGDREAGDRLVQANLRGAFLVARRYAWSGIDLDDLVQVAALGLLDAIPRFNPARGMRLLTYATWHMRGKLHRAMARGASLDAGDRAWRHATLPDEEGDPEDALLAEEGNRAARHDVAAALNGLPPRERRVLEGLYLADPPLRRADLAAELGVSRQRVQQLDHRARGRLRRALEVPA